MLGFAMPGFTVLGFATLGFALLGFATQGFAARDVCGDSKAFQSYDVKYHLQHKNNFLEKNKVTFSCKFQFEVEIPAAPKSKGN